MIGADQDRDVTDPLSGVNPLSGDLSLRDQGYKVTGACSRHPTLYMSLVVTGAGMRGEEVHYDEC